MQLAQILNNLMDERKISAYKLSKDTGISDRLIGYWKKGEKLPGAENLLTIANYFNTSIDYLLTGKELPYNSLSNDQQELIKFYKKLPEKEQIKLISRAEAIAEQYEEQQREYELKRQRNIEYISRDRFLEKVSAGTGLYLSDDSKEPMDIEKNDTTIMTDYILTVSGNSMEPLYHNGDMLMVKYQPKVNIGEIGIFIINGDGYVKKFGGDRLISLNAEYDDILLNENDSIYCQGKILGVLDEKLIKGEQHDSAV